jgi:hypothetical protein
MELRNQATKVLNRSGLVLLASLLGGQTAHADFLKDGSASIYLRNFYIDRDYENPAVADIGSWSQAATLRLESGYTDTPIQVGVDVLGQYAFRLNDRHIGSPDSIIPYDYHKAEQEQHYGKFGATLKLKYQKTELKIGTLEPKLPVVFFDDSRQLTTVYSGALLQSKAIKKLNLSLGFINRINARNDGSYEKLSLHNGTDITPIDSDGMGFVGLDYQFGPKLSGAYWYAQLLDIYQQHYANLSYNTVLDQNKIRLSASYFHNAETGEALNGNIDNQALNLATSINVGNHSFETGLRKMYGPSTFPTLAGYAPQPFLNPWTLLGFVRAEEFTWHLMYAYDFKGLGLPGLSATLRYLHGSNIYRAGLPDNAEIERSVSIKYVVPKGKLKNLGLQVTHFDTDTKYGTGLAKGNSYDETRIATTYTYTF